MLFEYSLDRQFIGEDTNVPVELRSSNEFLDQLILYDSWLLVIDTVKTRGDSLEILAPIGYCLNIIA